MTLKIKHWVATLLGISGITLGTLVPGGPIETRSFAHINPLTLGAFNTFLTTLVIGSLPLIYFVLQSRRWAMISAAGFGVSYLGVYGLDLVKIFPVSPDAMPPTLLAIEVLGTILAIVRSRPERITDVPPGSRVAVVTSLANRPALTAAFAGADAVLTALGVTSTSQDRSALLSENMATVEQAMLATGVNRIVLINTLLSSLPGKPTSLAMRFFSWIPGIIGRGAAEQQAVVDALGRGEFSSLRWTLVRGGLNAAGNTEPPVASADWASALNSWKPVSYRAMGRWMLAEAVANQFIWAAPLVSRQQ